jgi:DMSO/TMAO reductase YedYZ molybdopterin-dependent catalytic subunit
MTDKSTKQERGICELYQDDPERADALVFGRVAEGNRRGFLKGAGLAAMGAVVGGTIPFHREMPGGLIPAALAETTADFKIDGKDGLSVLNDRPINAETPAHLLDDEVTPTNRHFVRNNGIPPENMDPKGWKIQFDGELNQSATFTIDDLKKNFETVTLQLTVECGGNGRAAFNPPAKGNQWTVGAVASSEWTGVRMRDVLNKLGLKDSAVYTGHYSADSHLSGNPDKLPISRGATIEKMMDPNTIIAFGMNGEALHPMNGAPVRIVAAGWPGSVSQKWLTRVWVRDQVHDGPKMTGTSYRVPKYPVAPGTKVPKEDFEIIEAMPVKSLITFPESGAKVGRKATVRGHAWSGDADITSVDVSIDFGTTWIKTDLKKPANKFAWQHWSADLEFPMDGYYEVWARATDDKGRMQPFAINWNPKGYLNNSMHRISLTVA